MTIVDTSVWIDHFRGKDTPLAALLLLEEALLHPFVLGELLLGGLSREAARELNDVTRVMPASPAEVTAAFGWYGLTGTGIGYVDTHLLLSAKLLEAGRLLTSDRDLWKQAERLGLAYA